MQAWDVYEDTVEEHLRERLRDMESLCRGQKIRISQLKAEVAAQVRRVPSSCFAMRLPFITPHCIARYQVHPAASQTATCCLHIAPTTPCARNTFLLVSY